MEELCLMPWLRVTSTADPARGPTIPADPSPSYHTIRRAGGKCPKIRTVIYKILVFFENL